MAANPESTPGVTRKEIHFWPPVTEVLTYHGEPDVRVVEQGFRLVLQGLGVDLKDGHFKDTPARAARAYYDELCGGLTHAGPSITLFQEPGTPQMILLREIPVLSLCAHHLLPFVGTACVAYIPHGEVVLGLSKLSRMVDYYARRPQVQERLTNQVADYLWGLLNQAQYGMPVVPEGEVVKGGCGIFVRANHFCMAMRGVKHDGDMVTSALRGVFEEPGVKQEFMQLALAPSPK